MKRINPGTLLLACAAALGSVHGQKTDLETPLPVDPGVVAGKLPNGMAYWVKAHATPRGKIGFFLHVGSGSLDEEDDQRGLAHFLEHLAFNGSKHFPPGTLIRYFESIGLTFGQHSNAFTGFDQTTYILSLPDTRKETIGKGLLCLADFAHRLLLTKEEIGKERGVILEEARSRKGARQRILEKLLPAALPGSRVAVRLPIGTEKTIGSADRARILAYYEKWYRPDNATLIAVGDVRDVQGLVGQIGAAFGSWKASGPKPAGADPGIKPYARSRALVVTDPELTEIEVSAMRIRPLGRLATVGDFRARLVEQIGAWVVNRRLGDLMRKGTAPFLRGEVGQREFLNVVTLVDAEVAGKSRRWNRMLRSLLVEIKRARRHGFDATELNDAKKALLAAARHRVRTEPTVEAQGLLRRLNSLVTRGAKPISAAQRLELIERLLRGIEVPEVWSRFKEHYAPDRRLYVVQMPEKKGIAAPTEPQVMEVAAKAEAEKVDAPARERRARSLLEKEPAPGRLGVVSVTLANGVRLHLKRMTTRKGRVMAAINLAGGTISETDPNRGVSQAAGLAFAQPATRRLTSTQIRDLLTGKNVSVSGGALLDTLSLSVAGSPDDFADGLRLAHLLLTEPRIEASALARWKVQQEQALDQLAMNVQAQAVRQLSAVLSGNDPRFAPLARKRIRSITLAEAQKWLEGLVRTAPIEAAIVGDITIERALALGRRYLGSLPARPSIDFSLAPLRRLAPAAGPHVVRLQVDTITPMAVVLVGWRTRGYSDPRERRALLMAAQILEARLREEIREKRSLTYTVFGLSRAFKGVDEMGMLAAFFTADPAKAEAAAALARKVIEEFAAAGPTDEEMATVRKQFHNIVQTQVQNPGFWLSVLSDLDHLGTRLAEVLEILEYYRRFTRADLHAALKRTCVEERRFQIVAAPRRRGKKEK